MRLLSGVAVGLSVLSAMGIANAAERVTVDNFTRAETDAYFKNRVDQGCLGRFCHDRGPNAVDNQRTVRLNRDTPYSIAVFDLASPVTVVMPDAGKRFQSMMVINEDHYIPLISYDPGSFTLTADK